MVDLGEQSPTCPGCGREEGHTPPCEPTTPVPWSERRYVAAPSGEAWVRQVAIHCPDTGTVVLASLTDATHAWHAGPGGTPIESVYCRSCGQRHTLRYPRPDDPEVTP